MSQLEETAALLIRALRQERPVIPKPIREYRFDPVRRWRFDFAWPDQLVAIEIEGGTWARGRHNRPAGFAKDCEKYNAAALDGWRVLRYTGQMVNGGALVADLGRFWPDSIDHHYTDNPPMDMDDFLGIDRPGL